MKRLLHVVTSPRKQRSASTEVAQAFIDEYVAINAGTTVQRLELWDLTMPEFDGETMKAKYAGLAGVTLSDAQQRAWRRINELAQPFKEADVLVFSVPLWNFGVPYKLKHLIDVVSQKDVLFSFTPAEGLRGMLHGKTAVAVYARGLSLDEGSGTPARLFDYQQGYMEVWLNMIGVFDIKTILVEKTLLGPQADTASRQQAAQQAVNLAGQMS